MRPTCAGCGEELENCSWTHIEDRPYHFACADGWLAKQARAQRDAVKHPSHYADRVPGIECIEVVQHFNFNRGNVIKYVWRAGAKGDELEDLRKARQYLDFEIHRLENP